MSLPPATLTAASVQAPTNPADIRDAYRRYGYVTDQTVSTLLHRAAQIWPKMPALIEGERNYNYAQEYDLVQTVAAWMKGAGLGPGHVVCWQTPNWWEAQIIALAIWQIGAVSAPIVPLYREHELRQIIALARPAAVVTAAGYRGFDYCELLEEVLTSEGVIGCVKIVLRGSVPGWTAFDEIISQYHRQAPDLSRAVEPCLMLFTSGTTSAPKAVVHSSQSLLAETRQLADSWGLGWEDVAYMAAPLQHITGVLNAITVPTLVGACAVLAERWIPERAVKDMSDHRVTYSAGATVFLEELTDAARSAQIRLHLRNFACGGAPVPVSVMERSESQGIPASRVYGLTEHPTVTLMNRSNTFRARAETDGLAAPGVEIRIDSDDRTVATGSGIVGEVVVRGPERMLGYLQPSENDEAFEMDGWLRTGDLGTLDSSGYLTIVGRTKDLINRGGEKFSARDIEDLIAAHPAVERVAVVPGPDPRLGEVPVAYVVLRRGMPIAGDDLASFLVDAGLARQKIPVSWRFLDSLPTTSSGKVRKSELSLRAGESFGSVASNS